MTGAWSKGCRKHYAYYRCVTRGCSQRSKSVPRAKFEAGFEDVIKSLQPSQQLVDLAIAMFKDAWNRCLEHMQAEQREWQSQADAADKDILKLVDRLLESESPTVVKAIESKIEKLEREKLSLAEKAGASLQNVGRFEECIELALQFLARHWDLHKIGSYAVRQTVLSLVLSEPLTFTPEGVYRTIKTTIPFKVLGGIDNQKCEMVL